MLATSVVVVVIIAIAITWITVRFERALLGELAAIANPHEKLTSRIEIHKVSAQLLGGVAVIAGLVVAWLQLAASREQLNATIGDQARQSQLARDQYALARKAQAIDRVNTGIAGLGAGEPMVRMGAVLGLEQTATEFPDEYGAIAESLISSFLRRRGTIATFKAERSEGEPWPPGDVRAAVEALGRLEPEARRHAVSLRGLCLRQADLRNLKASGLNLADTDLLGANLEGAILKGADLDRSIMSGAILSNADLSAASLEQSDLSATDLSATILANAVLERADLRAAKLSIAVLANAKLRGADLRGARMVGAKLDGADLRGADLREVIFLTQAQVDMARGDSETQLPATLRIPESWQ